MESVQVAVKIELGHKASCKKTPSPEGFTHDWVVFVRGPDDCDISHFVEKVVFYLHESFAKPKRVLKNPPYTVAEAGYGTFFLPVEVYFKNKEEPRKLMFDYDLVLPAYGSPPIDNIRSEALTFTNPTEEFRKKLVKGGGIVTSTGTVNGFHSSSSPVSGSTTQQNMDAKDGKMTNSITVDSHPALQLSTPTQDPDKNKKSKHDAVVASKTIKMQEAVTPGLKRSASTSGTEDTQTQPVKKKKKKPDEASAKPNKSLGFIPLELPATGNEQKEKLEDVKDIKLKIKSLPTKSPASDKKKNRRSSLEVGSGENVPNTSKRRESTSSKKSKQKSPKDDSKQQVKQEEKKVEKITFRRRGSGDSWSSSTSSSSLLGNSSGNKNMALDKLLAEMSDEDDEDDDGNEVDICTPFQSRPLQPATTQKLIVDAVSSPNGTVHGKDSSSKGRTKTSCQSKKSEPVKNGRKNGVKSPTTKSLPSKQSPKTKLKDSKQGSNGQQNPSELIQLYKRLVALKDSTLLQRIADILETTGRFEVTETTLDFDLCTLDKTTIKKIESSINR